MKTDMLMFALGQKVYLKIKPESAGMVTGILFRPSGHSYFVTWASDLSERSHYELELTTEKVFAEPQE